MGVKSVPLKNTFRPSATCALQASMCCKSAVSVTDNQCEPSEYCYPAEALSWRHCTSSTRQATCAHWWPLNYQDSHSSLTCADCKI